MSWKQDRLQISRKRTVNSLSLSLSMCVRTLASSAIFSWLRRSLSCLPLDTSSSDRSRAKIRAIDISFHTPIRYTWLSRLILRFSPIFLLLLALRSWSLRVREESALRTFSSNDGSPNDCSKLAFEERVVRVLGTYSAIVEVISFGEIRYTYDDFVLFRVEGLD